MIIYPFPDMNEKNSFGDIGITGRDNSATYYADLNSAYSSDAGSTGGVGKARASVKR